MTKRKRDQVEYWMFIAPALVILLIICVIPIFLNFYYACFKWNGISSTKLFVGLDNFKKLLSGDPKFVQSVKFTIRYTVLYVLFSNAIALFVAVVLSNSKKIISDIGCVAFYIPCITASASTGLMWKFIFRDGMKSIYKLTGVEIFSKSWIGSIQLSFYAILIVGVWGSVGFYNIIYIAALRSVQDDIKEAAIIDGASKWQCFWKVIFPEIIPTFSTCILLSFINGFKVFDTIMLITGGGPAGYTTSLAYGIYSSAFRERNYGTASAEALIFFIALVILTVIELKVTRKVSE